ncbi:odorant receptor 88a [Drosophila nasuta]|uniref:odorant receptor 88a n=1 Tax=Drosophila nasuta TaxID=42062 RepID=UPI00295E38AF|nr:odorant receptor 88a [Drosophila nasuta]
MHIGRDESGRLCNKTQSVFYGTLVLHVCFFVGVLTEVVKGVLLGLPSNPNLPALFIGIFFSVRGVMIYVKHADIFEFLNILDEEFPHDLAAQQAMRAPQIYERFQVRYNYVAYIIQSAIVGFCAVPPIVYAFTRDVNGPIREEQQLLGGWLPFGIRENHNFYVLAWLYDIMCSCSGTAYFCTFDTIFNTMILHIIMHLDDLAWQLQSLDLTTEAHSEIYKQFCRLIHRHRYLNSFCDKFNSIFNLSIMITDLVAAAAICFHLYLVTETQDFLMKSRYMMVGVALVAFTYEICLRGTQLEEASSKLNGILYNQSWYVCDKRTRKLILMWIKYTQCTKKLNAFGLMELNMVHFSQIMNLAYRLFAFLKSA